jgi:hypothetical protein
MDYTCKPIAGEWPDKLTPASRRKRGPFSTSYNRTLVHLERELEHLGARNVVFQLALDERDIRQDGRPYASAKTRHPGVIITFNSRHGPLSYWTDQYADWQSNVRAISLALEALRSVDRHGVNKSGSQYQGYKRLNAAPSTNVNETPEADAARFIARHSGSAANDIYNRRQVFEAAYIEAAKKLHPDKGGQHELFVNLQQAAALLRRRHGTPTP